MASTFETERIWIGLNSNDAYYQKVETPRMTWEELIWIKAEINVSWIRLMSPGSDPRTSNNASMLHGNTFEEKPWA